MPSGLEENPDYRQGRYVVMADVWNQGGEYEVGSAVTLEGAERLAIAIAAVPSYVSHRIVDRGNDAGKTT